MKSEPDVPPVAKLGVPLVSVVIPFYNVEEYFEECLSTVLHQDLSDIEVILVDDGSRDGSRAIAERMAKTDGRVLIISHSENCGLGPARNSGARHARGKYILFLDSDDLLADENALSRLVLSARSQNCQVVVGSCDQLMPDYSVVEYDRKHDHQRRAGTIFNGKEAFLSTLGGADAPYLPLRAWGTLIDRSFYIDVDLDFPPGEHEDMAHTPFLYFMADRIYYEPTIVVHYRVRTNSLSRTPWSVAKLRRYSALWDEVSARMQRFGLSEHLSRAAAVHVQHLILRVDNSGIERTAECEYRATLTRILKYFNEAKQLRKAEERIRWQEIYIHTGRHKVKLLQSLLFRSDKKPRGVFRNALRKLLLSKYKGLLTST